MRWVKGIFQHLQKAVKEMVDGISTMIGDVYRLSNQMRCHREYQITQASRENRVRADNFLVESMAKSTERHEETMSQLQELLDHLTKPKKVIQEQRAQIRGWLAPMVTEDAQRELLGLRHGNSCDWFLTHEKFKNWSQYHSTRSKILWVHAPAGFGKSVLCARLIDHMHGFSEDFGRVLYFYCSGEDEARRHPFAILKSWMGQLVAKLDDAVNAVMEEAKVQQGINEGTVASAADQEYLWMVLKKLLTPNSRWTLVIDGFDECLDTSILISKYNTKPCTKSHFIQALANAIRGIGARVLLVSRNQPDIEAALKGSSMKDTATLVLIDHGITKEDTRQDLSSYAQIIFENKLGMDDTLSAMADDAADKSDGMFLWIALLNNNLQEGATLQAVEDLLKETPSEIRGAFQAELDRILDPRGKTTDRAVVILKWILYASRPLTVREMTEALAVSFNKVPDVYPRKDLPRNFAEAAADEKYVQNYIRMPCGSLIELHKASEDTPMEAQTIHFVHFSVKEFLHASQPYGPASNRRMCFGAENTEHDWIASLCLQYMCYKEFDGASREGIASVAKFSQIYPFYSYTAANWSDHYSHGSGSDTRSATMEIVWRLFSTSYWRVWAELFEQHSRETSRNATGIPRAPGSNKDADSGYGSMDMPEADSANESNIIDSENESADPSRDPEQELGLAKKSDVAKDGAIISPTPIYYAAILGLSEVINRLAAAKPSDCTLEGGDLGNPLQAAVVNGHVGAINALLEHGADPSQRGGRYGTPLIAAVFLGSMDIFDHLVASCKDLDTTDDEGKTALYHACALGALDMVKALVDSGADMTNKPEVERSPLKRAVVSDHVLVTKFLLQRGANVNERGRTGVTPLLLATIIGHVEMVATLLRQGADVTLADRGGVTALHLACYGGYTPIVRVLLDCDAVAIDAVDRDGWTPLHYAAEADTRDTAALLLERGASPLCKAGESGVTPYSLAVRSRSEAVMELFSSPETTSHADASTLVNILAVALDEAKPHIVKYLLNSVMRYVLGVDSVCDVFGLALKGNRKDIFHRLAGYIRGLRSSDAAEPERLTLWSDEEKHNIKSISWGTDTQKDMVLDPVWRLYPAATEVVPNAMLPIAVSNRSMAVVTLLLRRNADMYRQIAFTRATAWSLNSYPSSVSPLQIAVDQDSRELVALMLGEGRSSGSREHIMGLLAALEQAGSGGGMRRVELTRMLIVHGALDADADRANMEPANEANSDCDGPISTNEDADSGVEEDLVAADNRNPDTRDEEIRDLAWWEAALAGEWKGYYTYRYRAPSYTEPTSFRIDSITRKSLSRLGKAMTLFDGGGKDTIGEFTIHGQVQGRTTVKYTKLYNKHGWMYEGKLDETDSGWCMEGQWGASFRAPRGRYVITKKMQM